MRYAMAVAVLLASFQAWGQVPFPAPAQAMAFADEAKDWGVAPTTSPRQTQVHAPTPSSVPGGRVIKTLELKALLEANNQVLVVDVLDGKNRVSVPGAYWMVGGGDGKFYAAEKSRFKAALDQISGGDVNRPVVFLCSSSECWLSYNAALHAIEAGYKDVIWYRGGMQAWHGASLERKKPRDLSW